MESFDSIDHSVLLAISKTPNPSVFQKTLALNDFYFGSKEWPYPMGHISFVGKLDGVTLSAGAPARNRAQASVRRGLSAP